MPDDDAGTVAREGNEPEPDAGTPATSQAPGGLWGRRSVRVAASVVALLLATGVGLGVTSAVRGSVPADARIPSPPSKNAVFVEDNNGAGADQQNFILQSSARGVVCIRSARGTLLGSGFVITRSGFVLTSYHGLQGSGTLTARLVMSGKTYPVRLVGSDPEANLALLQLSGGADFTPVAIGTAADIHMNDRVASVRVRSVMSWLQGARRMLPYCHARVRETCTKRACSPRSESAADAVS